MQCSSDSDSILGVFYDGCQNTNISILSRDGREIISYHLGDLTGKKSDGRSPKPLIDKLSINDFSACAWPFKNTISSNEEQLGKIRSQFHTVTHHFQNFDANLFSPDIFQAFVQSIPLPHEWWGYPESLAAFSYFTSGKTKGSIILVYDQPTWNSPFFGGVFLGKGCSLQALELFHQGTHCCFSSFWNAVSLMIDLNPYNARPQVELLAAGSEPNSRCIDILYDIFVNDFGELSSGIKWNVSQAEMLSPLLLINETLFSDFRDKMSKFSKGCIAASLQSLLLAHLQEIIDKLAAAGLSDSIYLAGELFQSPQLRANLMAQSGFDTVFMSTVNAKREASAGAALLSWGKHYGELPCLRESATRLKCFTAPKEDFLYEEKLKDFAEKVASHITKKDQEIDKLQEIVNKKNQEIERLQGAVIASMSFRNCIRILPSACFFGFQRRFLKLCPFFRPSLGTLGNLKKRKPLHFKQSNISAFKLPIHSPRISVVIPSFNQATFLEGTIKSLVDEGYPKLEILIADGGSSDNSVEVIRKFSDHLTWWVSEPDRGQTHAINKGFAVSNGEIMAWLNSDDQIVPGTLAYVANFFAKNPDIDVVYGHRILVDENNMEIGRWVLAPHSDEILKWVDYVPQETMFWRKRIWEKVGARVDESYNFAMDWDLLLRFIEAGAKIARLPKFMGIFRIHSAQKTSSLIEDVGFQEMKRLRKQFLGYNPTPALISRKVTGYMLKSLFLENMWKIGLINYN